MADAADKEITEYDDMEIVRTPDDEAWIEIEPEQDKKFPENPNKEKMERVDLAKMSVLENSVKSGKNRPEAFRELYEFTQKDTTAVVLTVAVMHAQEFSFYPKDKDKEAVNPVLVPYVAKVMKGALYNQNRDANVIEVSEHTLDNIAKSDLGKDDIKKVQEQIKELEKLLAELKKKVAQTNRENNENINSDTARVVYATKYMGARGMDFVADNNGQSMLLPRSENSSSLPVRINAELQRQSGLQSEKQKSAAPLLKSKERE